MGLDYFFVDNVALLDPVISGVLRLALDGEGLQINAQKTCE